MCGEGRTRSRHEHEPTDLGSVSCAAETIALSAIQLELA